MKVGFLGNTNNYPFMLARAVRALGHDVVFIVHRRERLHRPEYRYDDVAYPYPSWISDVSLRFRQILTRGRHYQNARDLLKECDALVLNDIGPAVAAGLRIPRATIITGSDLELFADLKAAPTLIAPFVKNRNLAPLFAPAIYPLIRMQRAGLRESKVVAYFPRGLQTNGDRILDELGIDERQRLFFLMADIEAIAPQPPPDNPVLRIFCVARLTWKRPAPGTVELDFKGTDVLVRGVARFHRETGNRVELHLVRKGLHVRETEELVRQEKIDHLVVWRDEITQRQVLSEYAAADIVVDQFSKALVGMGGLEAMATGRPLLADGHPEIFEPIHGSAPICQARTETQIADQLRRLVDRSTRAEIGLASRRHVERWFSPRAAAESVIGRLTEGAQP